MRSHCYASRVKRLRNLKSGEKIRIEWFGDIVQNGTIFGHYIKYSDGSLISKRKISIGMRRNLCTVYKYEDYLSDI